VETSSANRGSRHSGWPRTSPGMSRVPATGRPRSPGATSRPARWPRSPTRWERSRPCSPSRWRPCGRGFRA
jgi:hypothetical protein